MNRHGESLTRGIDQTTIENVGHAAQDNLAPSLTNGLAQIPSSELIFQSQMERIVSLPERIPLTRGTLSILIFQIKHL